MKNNEYLLSTKLGYTTHKITIYIIKANDNFLKKLSEAPNIFPNSSVFLSTNGLNNEFLITGPIPPSSKDMYAKNCAIDDISPLTSEPKFLIIIIGTINP